jgi:hypothetical protein
MASFAGIIALVLFKVHSGHVSEVDVHLERENSPILCSYRFMCFWLDIANVLIYRETQSGPETGEIVHRCRISRSDFGQHRVLKTQNGLTQRAADKWDSARFLAVFNASAGFRFRALPTSRPLAANANR